jgi:serine/threonine protein kinase
LGAGSFGTVYKVYHLERKKIYAMKALKKENLIKRK